MLDKAIILHYIVGMKNNTPNPTRSKKRVQAQFRLTQEERELLTKAAWISRKKNLSAYVRELSIEDAKRIIEEAPAEVLELFEQQ